MNHRERVAAAQAKRDLPLIELRADAKEPERDPELAALELVYAGWIEPKRAAAQGESK